MWVGKISWTAGEVVYKVGDEPDFAYFLTKYEVEILSEKDTRVGFINEEEVFIELSILLNTKKRTVSTIALTESIALLIPKENLLNDYNKAFFLLKHF